MQKIMAIIHKNGKMKMVFLCKVQKTKKTFDFCTWTVHNKYHIQGENIPSGHWPEDRCPSCPALGATGIYDTPLLLT